MSRSPSDPGPAGYRDPATEPVTFALRAGKESRGWANALVAMGLCALALEAVVPGLAYLGLLFMAFGLPLVWRYRRTHAHVVVDERGLTVRTRNRQDLRIARADVTAVERRPLGDRAVAQALDPTHRHWFRVRSAKWVVCVRTTDGDVHPLGPPIDREAADALVRSIGDRLRTSGSTPSADRVRVVVEEERAAEVVPAADPESERTGLAVE